MQTVLDLANTHYTYGKSLHTAAAAKLLPLWAGINRRHILRSWLEILPEATAIVTAAQLAAAQDADRYMDAALKAQKLDTEGPPVAAAAFAGIAYPLDAETTRFDLKDTLTTPAFTALIGIRGGLSIDRAMGGGLNDLLLRSQMQVSDAARNAGSVKMASRAKPAGWVRMLNPPSCSRCTILAGKYFKYNQGFARHPGCDCRHIPAPEDTAGDVMTDPYEYFKSLDPGEQARVFTKAGAAAINDGADIFQVVNARAGMHTTAGGSKVTYSGTTRRGYWGSTQVTRDRRGKERYGVAIRQRMMPEEIYKRSNSQAQTLAMLEQYGYITSVGQVPTGAIRGPGVGLLGGRKPNY